MTVAIGQDVFARSVRKRLFAPSAAEHRRVGLEIEMLPLLADTGAPCPLEPRASHDRATLTFVREYGASQCWTEQRSLKGAPYFRLPNGWTLTFEPGGQIELCTTPTAAIGDLVARARRTVTALRCAADDVGIELACVGIDPNNEVTATRLQIASDRYVKMASYFERIGPSGARMMRQTAATQVSLDGGVDPQSRWRLLADASPFLTALFANSPRYAGRETGFQSFRERCWRLLDVTRTGVPHPELPPCEAYTRFALDAIDMTRTTAMGEYRAFGEWVAHGDWTEAQWENHLTTLFPEVRPRAHLEVRSIDALTPELLGAPVLLLAGLAYDKRAAAEARSLLPPADDDLLNRAARCGLRDSEIARIALSLAEIGLRGAHSLGEARVSGPEIERARAFVREWPARGLSLADAR